MRCERCEELETSLWRVKLPIVGVRWFCRACMEETGHELDPETIHLTEVLKQWKDPRTTNQ
jgi:hypothetical protein